MTTTREPSGAGGDRASERIEPAWLEAVLRVHRTLDLEDALRLTLRHAVEMTAAECGFVYLRAADGGRLIPRVSTLAEDDVRRGWVREIVADPDDLIGASAERDFDGLGPFGAEGASFEGRSIGLPVRGGAPEAVATLLLVSPDEKDRGALHRFLREVRPAIANATRVDSMRELIIKDDTAGCYNRRHFEASLPEELSRAQRFRAPMSLIFFDLDNLKQVNSLHGHPMGSRTLYEVSVRVRSKIRKFDKLFRFGGDEFCILLPETEWHGALEVAERVREAIAGSNFLAGLVSDPAGVRITASFGIASFPLHARTKEDIIVQADRAMQRIKNGTKNSIAIAEIQGDTDGL